MANFLSLPGELREQIYDEYLKIVPSHEKSRLNIVLASSKVYHEIAVRVYASTRFRVTRTDFPSLATMDDILRNSIKQVIFDVMAMCNTKSDAAAGMLKAMHSNGVLPVNYKLVFRLSEYYDLYLHEMKAEVEKPLQHILCEIIKNNPDAETVRMVLLTAQGSVFESRSKEYKEKKLVEADCCFALMKTSGVLHDVLKHGAHRDFRYRQIGQRTEYEMRFVDRGGEEIPRPVKILPVVVVDPENAYKEHYTGGSETYTPVDASPWPDMPGGSNVQKVRILQLMFDPTQRSLGPHNAISMLSRMGR